MSDTNFDSYIFRQLDFDRVDTNVYDYDTLLKSTLLHYANAYSANIISDEYISNINKVKWYCFECKKEIDVDVSGLVIDTKTFNSRKLFCDVHKPPTKSNIFKQNYLFNRYLISFHSYLKKIIINNSKTKHLSAWKELQQLELMSQSIQQESLLSYQKRKNPRKKLFTFKSALKTK
ncbi:hypothetical protein HYO65_gp036 [Tenacibaculum phage PTm1]|uniref:Uncharacterized protein n=2 Tax=Shirahamavirus PTm1 TaxID=2846435 RepID=A0A5S9EQQ2_9CAUD|nr:hypothetical protein HYO65_gp036 [Tenacibaculum phage PTm1]BBI90428.1 hypothetical protein [Tenacibaculum phage PTm1]BBI90735.1 hypothetical protein [Tenacibaculum phage PTm5]